MVTEYNLIRVNVMDNGEIEETVLKTFYDKRELRAYKKIIKKSKPHWDVYVAKSSVGIIMEY